MKIKFKYHYDPLSDQYILTSKIYFDNGELYLWDTTIEETYSRALQLADVKAHVEWDLEDNDAGECLDNEEEEYKSYRDEEQRVCRDRCLAELDDLEGYNYKYHSKYDEEGYDY